MAHASNSVVAESKRARLERLEVEYQAVSSQLEVENSPRARVQLEGQLRLLEQEMSELEEQLRQLAAQPTPTPPTVPGARERRPLPMRGGLALIGVLVIAAVIIGIIAAIVGNGQQREPDPEQAAAAVATEAQAGPTRATLEATAAPEADNDGDGLSNRQELSLATDADNPDTDGDGVDDGVEVNRGTNPLQPEATATPAPASGSGDTSIAEISIETPIELELVRVPAGEFLMGSDPSTDLDADDDELPQHAVYVSEFYIGKHEVTNEQYAAFVQATGYRAPSHWVNDRFPPGLANHPVVNVGWEAAYNFTRWLSSETAMNFRLPTEAEWEKACRGTEGELFPWGDGYPSGKLLNFTQMIGDTTAAGSYSPQGDSPYGAADMAGNVSEWVADWYGEDYYGRSAYEDPPGPTSGSRRILRGGSYFTVAEYVRCAFRIRATSDLTTDDRGFRVAASP